MRGLGPARSSPSKSFYTARPGVTPPPLLIVTAVLLLQVGLKRRKNSLNIIQQRHICKVVIVIRSTCVTSLNSLCLPTVRPSSAGLQSVAVIGLGLIGLGHAYQGSVRRQSSVESVHAIGYVVGLHELLLMTVHLVIQLNRLRDNDC